MSQKSGRGKGREYYSLWSLASAFVKSIVNRFQVDIHRILIEFKTQVWMLLTRLICQIHPGTDIFKLISRINLRANLPY